MERDAQISEQGIPIVPAMRILLCKPRRLIALSGSGELKVILKKSVQSGENLESPNAVSFDYRIFAVYSELFAFRSEAEQTEGALLLHLLYATIAVVLVVQLSAFATSIYLHRTLAHRGVYLHPVVAFPMRLQLWLWTGINTKEWVAVHRKHHRHTDVEGDPHSPVLEGLWRILLGNVYYYTREAKNAETLTTFAPDIGNDWLDRYIFGFGLAGVILGISIFMLILGPVWGGAAFLVQASTYIFLNAVINGANHAIGKQNFDNTATNLGFIALLTAGEGWHNNHHAYPTSARFSISRGEFDPSWPVIKMLTWMHLARPLKLAPKME